MIISEITDCTIVLEKAHKIWDFIAMRDEYERQFEMLYIFKPDVSFELYRVQDALFAPDIIILYLKKVPEEFHQGDIVGIRIGYWHWYEYNYENSRAK